MELKPHKTQGARVEPNPGGWKLWIPAGSTHRYRLAQLDNCTRIARRDLPHHSIDMRLRARVSSASVPGTWGFGVWNDPYRMSLGPGETLFHALALPNAAWFFYSPPQSHLSFRDDKPGNGLLAQTFRSRSMPWLPLTGVAATFLFSRVQARRQLSRLIDEEALRVSLDATQWHEYGMRWEAERVIFEVDSALALETDISPKPPLGAVIWIDNQYAAFTPDGKVAFGVLENPEGWMEIEDLRIT